MCLIRKWAKIFYVFFITRQVSRENAVILCCFSLWGSVTFTSACSLILKTDRIIFFRSFFFCSGLQWFQGMIENVRKTAFYKLTIFFGKIRFIFVCWFGLRRSDKRPKKIEGFIVTCFVPINVLNVIKQSICHI